ncbi:aldo/keto reductase [Rhodanobacter soli]|jgi:1-deoxyxylulose-5-phosphate synthase|uniref:Aryl-alcohol dehydrogenase-like predicted oxidoreductase n=1 Tax=Rhodanobacter soli TaxID=590609 RepID=A0ABV2PXP9_9GAMM
MDYINLGKSGLKVSRICLGCMSYEVTPAERPWHLDEEHARPFIRRALELGINYFDTANMYSSGDSELVLGRALRDFARREEVVIATKVFYPMRGDANGGGLSRKAIMTEIDASLRRLGTDHVDLYQIHRWDAATPIEETLEALHDVVKAGKARYLGASSMSAWQFAKALYTADLHGWTRFVAMQPHYNLLYREEEREMLALCADQGIGVVPWSPLARGRLARAWEDEPSTVRGGSDPWGDSVYAASKAADKAVVDRVGEVAARLGVPRAQVALAWLLQQPVVTAPIVGATRPHHLEEAVAALSVSLPPAEIAALEAPYAPHAVAGID